MLTDSEFKQLGRIQLYVSIRKLEAIVEKSILRRTSVYVIAAAMQDVVLWISDIQNPSSQLKIAYDNVQKIRHTVPISRVVELEVGNLT